MAKAIRKTHATTKGRKTRTGNYTVREFSEEYGLKVNGDPSERLSTYLQNNGQRTLGHAMETLESELGAGR